MLSGTDTVGVRLGVVFVVYIQFTMIRTRWHKVHVVFHIGQCVGVLWVDFSQHFNGTFIAARNMPAKGIQKHTAAERIKKVFSSLMNEHNIYIRNTLPRASRESSVGVAN